MPLTAELGASFSEKEAEKMKKKRKLNGGAKMGFLFALPAAIYMLVFIGYPMVQNLSLIHI